MLEWAKGLNGKDIVAILTGAGGIILAGFLAYALFKINTNDLEHLEAAVGTLGGDLKEDRQETGQIIREVTKVIEQNSNAIQQNTKSVEQLNQNLFLKR